MKRIIFFYLILGVITLNAGNFFRYPYVGIKANTLGPGIELGASLTDNLSFRLGVNNYKYKLDSKSDNLQLDLNARLRSGTAIFDYHLFSGGFILSAGMVYNKNGLSLKAIPTDGNDGSYKLDLDFPKYSPYVGIGYSTASIYEGFHFEFNLGAVHEGDANLDLTTQCSDAMSKAECTDLKNDAKDEKDALKDMLAGISKYIQWYPVISLGLAYTF